MPINWDCTTTLAFFDHSPPHDSCLPRWCQEPDTSEDGQTAALPCQGPVLTSTTAQQSAQADGYDDITRQRNTLLNSDDLSRVLGSPMWTNGEDQDWTWGRGRFCGHLSTVKTSQGTRLDAFWSREYRKSVQTCMHGITSHAWIAPKWREKNMQTNTQTNTHKCRFQI